MLPLKTPGENTSLPLPASGGWNRQEFVATSFQSLLLSSAGLLHVSSLLLPFSSTDTCIGSRTHLDFPGEEVLKFLITSAKDFFPNKVTLTGSEWMCVCGRPSVNQLLHDRGQGSPFEGLSWGKTKSWMPHWSHWYRWASTMWVLLFLLNNSVKSSWALIMRERDTLEAFLGPHWRKSTGDTKCSLATRLKPC